MKSVACIYHKDCIDGTTAAAVVLRKFPNAQCFPVSHSRTKEEMAAIIPQIPADATVYFVDTVSGLEDALAQGNEIVVLDHHESEAERVRKIATSNPHLTYVFDNAKSGASLAWAYFFGDESISPLVAHVEDIDLWKHALGEGTEHVANYLSLLRNDPAAVLACLNADIDALYAQGTFLTRNAEEERARLLELAPVALTLGTYTVAAFNITNHQSHTGNVLSHARSEAVALYTIRGDIVRFSFRSQDGQEPSALDLATTLGGGGHQNSAGATMSLRDFINAIRF